MRYDVVGLGNALVDALVVLEHDGVVEELGLIRGTMHLVDHDRWQEVHEHIRHLEVLLDSGGSCANAVATAGLLGARTTMVGRVGDDDLGQTYRDRMAEACGAEALQIAPGAHTGKCLSMISSVDAERTMVTDLGAATNLPDLEGFAQLASKGRLAHFTGYTMMDEAARRQVVAAMEQARAAGVRISLDAADPMVVQLLRDTLWELIDTTTDLVFLNREEAEMLAGVEAERAIEVIGERTRVGTAVVKLGADGSLVLAGGRLHRIEVNQVDAVDTTGAGDAYAGGFLYGYVNGWPAPACGRLASAVAASVVSQVGARVTDRDLLQRLVAEHAPRPPTGG